MDWREIVAEAAKTAELSDAQLTTHLAALAASAPHQAEAVARLARTTRAAGDFMRTSAADTPAEPEPEPSLAPGALAGAWRIESFIGAGGMGEVYRAARADGRYEHAVALKVLQRQLDDARAEAFERERRRLARLDHPGVARIIDGGETEDGRPFMAMELVEGAPIDVYAEARGLTRKQRLRLVAQACDAAAHAHGRLVLHRDIKAPNVLVSEDGAVKLIDFGIASLLDDDEQQAGPLTLATAAPEQLFGDPASAATDVFSLGVLACHLATGRMPERRADGGMSIDAAALADKDLAAILEKATAFDPEARYRSASALADDIRAWLDRRPVSARAGGWPYHARKLVGRYPVASGLAALALVALTGGLGVSLHLGAQTREALTRAEYFLGRAEFNAATSSTYAGLIDEVFRTPEDAARIRAVMRARADDAFANYAENPERAAETTLVAGRHFLFTGEFAQAVSILSRWVEAEFGDPDVLRGGKLILGLAYLRVGDEARARALMEEVAAAFDNPLERLSMENIQLTTELALITSDPDQIAAARELLSETLALTDVPEERVTVLHFLQLIARRLGDFQLGYETAREAVAAFDANPMMEVNGWGAVHMHLAGYEFYFRHDADAALAIVERILARGEGFVGPDGISSALRVRADIEMSRGELDAAGEDLTRARALERMGFGHDHYGRTSWIELLVMRGALDEAQAELDGLVAEFPDVAAGGVIPARIALAAAYLAAVRDGPEAGSQILYDNNVTQALIYSRLSWPYYYAQLEALGVEAPLQPR